jgi:hypothetical protein
MSRRDHFLMLLAPVLYFLGQLLVGTSSYVALLFSAAILFGLYSIAAAGGLTTAFGMLNAILITKVLLIGIALKILILEPSEMNLDAPETTAAVMFFGFFGLLVGTCLQRSLPTPPVAIVPGVSEPRMYLALTIVFLVCGYGGYFVGLGPDLAGEGVQAGGVLGLARNLSAFKSFAIVPALFFAWARGKRFMTHPLVIGVLAVGVIAGIFTTGKLEAMEPLVFYVLVGILRYGLRDKRLWALAAIAISYYATIIYPYSQYVRYAGGREGSLYDRVEVMKDVFWRMTTDDNFRQFILAKRSAEGPSYLDNEALKPFSRLAMVAEEDALISATEQQQSFTGWQTLTWGFKLMAPSFLYPDKPIWGSGNYLAHISGQVGSTDETTQVSYGVMANFYNAFSYPGVLIGSIIFFCLFYYWLRIFFRNPRWNATPTGATLWFLLLVATFQHSLIESTVAGLIPSLWFPCIVLILYAVSMWISGLLPNFAAATRTNESSPRS